MAQAARMTDTGGMELLERFASGASRDDLFRALLRQVSGPGPVNVVVVEDIHWADEATMDLLRFAGRRLRDTRSCWSSPSATTTWPRTINCGSRWAS